MIFNLKAEIPEKNSGVICLSSEYLRTNRVETNPSFFGGGGEKGEIKCPRSIIEGGKKEYILPIRVKSSIDFRILYRIVERQTA